MLIIKGKGGLGNRILSAVSGILYAEATGRDYVIDWRDGIYANRPANAYPLLFNAQIQPPIPDNSTDCLVIPDIWQHHLAESPSQMISRFYPTQHSHPLVYRKLSAPLCHKEALSNPQVIEVFWAYTSKIGRVKKFLDASKMSYRSLMRETLMSHFTPCESVLNQVETLCIDSTATLGVHIRYTDLKVPLHRVLNAIEKRIAAGGYRNIFLATDNLMVEQQVTAGFDNVMTAQKVFADNEQQLHTPSCSDDKLQQSYAALVDMYALSKCAGLIYSSRSTFAKVSQLLGEESYQHMIDIDKFNPIVQGKNLAQEYL